MGWFELLFRALRCEGPVGADDCVPFAVRAEAGIASLPPQLASRGDRVWELSATPAEIAAVIHFVASSGASYPTGQGILVDGGRIVHGNL